MYSDKNRTKKEFLDSRHNFRWHKSVEVTIIRHTASPSTPNRSPQWTPPLRTVTMVKLKRLQLNFKKIKNMTLDFRLSVIYGQGVLPQNANRLKAYRTSAVLRIAIFRDVLVLCILMRTDYNVWVHYEWAKFLQYSPPTICNFDYDSGSYREKHFW